MRTVRLVAAGLVLAALGGCGADGGKGAEKGIPAGAATALADRADRIAGDIAAGACDQALAEAQTLQGDLAAMPADPALRAEAVAGAARLVGAITCGPPATAGVTPGPDPVADPGSGKGKKGKRGHGDEN